MMNRSREPVLGVRLNDGWPYWIRGLRITEISIGPAAFYLIGLVSISGRLRFSTSKTCIGRCLSRSMKRF